jgi:outer membrane murein-binding lipoprotein Lpp
MGIKIKVFVAACVIFVVAALGLTSFGGSNEVVEPPKSVSVEQLEAKIDKLIEEVKTLSKKVDATNYCLELPFLHKLKGE